MVSVSDVPEVWPVQLGTNLTCKKILSLKNARFRLPQRKEMTPSQFFQDHPLPLDLASYTTPAYPDDFPTRRSWKLIRRNKKAPSTKQANNCATYTRFFADIMTCFPISKPLIFHGHRFQCLLI